MEIQSNLMQSNAKIINNNKTKIQQKSILFFFALLQSKCKLSFLTFSFRLQYHLLIYFYIYALFYAIHLHTHVDKHVYYIHIYTLLLYTGVFPSGVTPAAVFAPLANAVLSFSCPTANG